jgi:hypothetical protein
MPLPFLIQFENGFQVVNLPMVGEGTMWRQFKVPIKPEKVTPNPWESVLAEEIEEVREPHEERRRWCRLAKQAILTDLLP